MNGVYFFSFLMGLWQSHEPYLRSFGNELYSIIVDLKEHVKIFLLKLSAVALSRKKYGTVLQFSVSIDRVL